jgi:hypothetical protein
MLLEEPPDFDRLRRRVAAVRIDEQSGAVSQGAADGGDDLLGAAGPLVAVVAALPPDADLERGEAVAVSQLGQTPRLVSRRDVARMLDAYASIARRRSRARSPTPSRRPRSPRAPVDPGQRPADI